MKVARWNPFQLKNLVILALILGSMTSRASRWSSRC